MASGVEPMTDPMWGIGEGRIVHYTAYNGRHLAAIITGTSKSVTRLEGTEVDLVVFTDMDNVNGQPSGGVQFHFSIPESTGATPGHWHWPERV